MNHHEWFPAQNFTHQIHLNFVCFLIDLNFVRFFIPLFARRGCLLEYTIDIVMYNEIP